MVGTVDNFYVLVRTERITIFGSLPLIYHEQKLKRWCTSFLIF